MTPMFRATTHKGLLFLTFPSLLLSYYYYMYKAEGTTGEKRAAAVLPKKSEGEKETFSLLPPSDKQSF